MAVRQVTGTLSHADSTPWAGATVRFAIDVGTFTLTPDVTYLQDVVTATTIADGTFTVDLTSGLSVYWRCTLPDGEAFLFGLSDGAPITLEELRAFYAGIPVPIAGNFAASDFVVTAPHTGEILAYNGANFVNRDNEAFNVVDFGATGDGSTDDTTAIQSAITAVDGTGGVVFFPAGTYAITDTLSTSSPYLTLAGVRGQSILRCPDGALVNQMVRFLPGAHYGTVKDLVFDGNRTNDGTSSILSATAGIEFYNALHGTVTDVEIFEVGAVGISYQITLAAPLTDVYGHLTRVYAHDNGMTDDKYGNGVQVYQASGITFTDCRFERNYGTGHADIGQYAGAGIANHMADIVCTGCHFRDNFNGGGQVAAGGDATFLRSWHFTNCRFDLTVADPQSTSGIEFTGRSLLVTNCVFNGHEGGPTDTAAIVLQGDGGSPTPGHAVITGNHFLHNTEAISHEHTGAIANVVFAGNMVEIGDRGISLSPSGDAATNITIVGNDFSNVTTPITDGGATNLLISGNLPSTINRDITIASPSSATAPTLHWLQSGAVQWNASAEATTGQWVLEIDGGQEALRIQRSGSNVSYVSLPNGSLGLKDGVTAPSAVTGLALIYVDTADGSLKVRFSDGTITTIATNP